jgi:hypothetical protein
MRVNCPHCGREGRLPEGVAVPPAVRCPQCKAKFAPVSNEEPGTPAASKPWYKDPILQFAMAFPTVVLICFASYLLYQQSKTQFRNRITASKVEGDKLQAASQLGLACDKYQAVIAEGGGSSDPDVQRAVADATVERDKVRAVLKAELEREEADRRRKLAEAHERETARWAAEEKARRDLQAQAERQERQEAGRRQKERDRAFAQAESLEAPPQNSFNMSDPFKQQTRKLAEDEFAFKDATGRLFKATFDQKFNIDGLVKIGVGSNVIISPGKYDFKNGQLGLTLYAWYNYLGANDTTPITTEDFCGFLATFALDENTARRWREEIDRKSFRATVWFRLKSVARHDWNHNPHFTNGLLAHQILFDIEVVKYETTAH